MNRFKYLFVVALLLHLLTLLFDVGSSYQLALGPEVLGPLAAAGGSVIGGIANSIIGNSQAKSNARYSANLQKELMDYSWNKYNSPKAQAAAYSDAGFNPSVAFGQGGMSAPIAPSNNSPEVSTSPVPFDIGLQNIPNAILALSEAKKAGSETAGQEMDNKIKESSLNELIKSAAIANKWKSEEINRIMQEAYNLQGQNTKLQEEISLLRKQGVTLDLENENWQKRFNAEMRAYADKHNIDAQELKQMQEQAPYILGKLKSEDSLLNLESEVQGDFKEVNAKLGVVGKVLGFISEFVKKR